MWSEVVLPLLLFWVLFLRKYVPIPIIDTELGKLRDEIADLRKRVTKLEAQLAAGGGGGGAPPAASPSPSSPDAPPSSLRKRPGSIQTSKPVAAAPSKDAGEKVGAKEKAPPSTPMTPEDVLLDDAFVHFTESEAELATRNDSMLEETMEEILDQKFCVATGTPTAKPGGRRF